MAMKTITIRLVLSFALSIQPALWSEVGAGTAGSREKPPGEVWVHWLDAKKVEHEPKGESFSFPRDELREAGGEGAAEILENAIRYQMLDVQEKKKRAKGEPKHLIQEGDVIKVLVAYMDLAPNSPLRNDDASLHTVGNSPYRVSINNRHTLEDLLNEHTLKVYAEVHVTFSNDADK